MATMHKSNKGVFLILLSTLAFGSYGVWSKLIGANLGPFFQGWTRGLVLSIVLVPILLYKKELVPIKKKDWGWLAVFLVFTSFTQAPIFYAYTHMDIGSASLLFFSTILITMYVIGFAFLKEKVTKLKIISFLLALIGLYTIFSFSLERFAFLAALMAVVNGIASGGEVAFSKKLSSDYSPLYVTLTSWLVIIPTNGLLSVILGEKQILPGFQLFWLWQVAYIIVSLFGFWLVVEGLKHVEASIGGLMGLLEVVFSVAFGIIIFKESLTTRIIIGALFILAAASLPHVSTLLKKQSR
jgi:drug/metabolite transporter (DMT)-like permease